MRYGYLEGIGEDRVAFVTQASEAAFIVSKKEDVKCEIKLEILTENVEFSNENLYVALRENSVHLLSTVRHFPYIPKVKVILPRVCIEFEVKHSYFNMLIKAVNRIQPKIINRILPNPKDFFELINYQKDLLLQQLPSNIKIDDDQLKALHMILSCDKKSPPVVVNGSFGTGKTRLLALATCCVVQHGKKTRSPVKVLVCAHHQVSADHFIEEYFGNMFKKESNVELVRLISQSDKPSQWSNYKSVYIPFHIYNDKKAHQSHPTYLVVVTTFDTAPELLKIFKDDFFTHIFMDEGSQVTEPEAISPLCLAGLDTKIVIAGDPCQVSYCTTIVYWWYNCC